MADDQPGELKTEELTAIIREIRDRVRARYPDGPVAGGAQIPLIDLMPILHARDAAEGKVAAIGAVNPRPPGLLNNAAQAMKKLTARLLDWHVREQVEFNRAVVASLDAILEALNENNRTFTKIAAALDQAAKEARELRAEAAELKDVRSHWAEWRADWERKLATNEVQFLRSVADLQTAFQHRATLMETNFRDLIRTQHTEFTAALERSVLEVQKRLWEDLERVRREFERLIHSELRLIRLRASLPERPAGPAPVPAAPPPEAPPEIDWLKFAERFRGSEEYVREKQRLYVPWFERCQAVLDLGCGRGEFLELLRDTGVPARGVDLNEESVALCREKGLDVQAADLFAYLNDLPESALDGIFCAQVIEHLPPGRLPELMRLAAARLGRGGLLVMETPNPECLAIFATHYYLDPTHRHPVPPALLVFYFEEHGFGQIEVRRLSPAVESIPSLAALPEDFRSAFFGGLDYAIFGRKLA